MSTLSLPVHIAVITQAGGVIAPIDCTRLFSISYITGPAITSRLKVLDLNNLDTSNVTSMSGMFYFCSRLTSLDLTSFDTSKVTDMTYMFYTCSSLTSITVGCNWTLENAGYTTDMFSKAGTSSVTKVCN